jgi:hypothetical protein
VVEKTDTGIWARCKKPIILALFILFLLWYLNKLVKKPRFKKGKKRSRARILVYNNSLSETPTTYELRTNFINRYLNPFGVETKKVRGLKFIATKSAKIDLSGDSINENIRKGEIELEFNKSKDGKYKDQKVQNMNIITKINHDKSRTYYQYKI